MPYAFYSSAEPLMRQCSVGWEAQFFIYRFRDEERTEHRVLWAEACLAILPGGEDRLVFESDEDVISRSGEAAHVLEAVRCDRQSGLFVPLTHHRLFQRFTAIDVAAHESPLTSEGLDRPTSNR